MDYTALIKETKDKLDNFSFDDSVYDDIYAVAYENLQKAYQAESAALDSGYAESRRQAAGDNALSTKNLSEQLAARGLAKSGESAMLRINQAISLNNALASLAQANTKAKAELAGARENELAKLQSDIATQKSEAMEKEKQNLYDRLEHLEKLSADDEGLKAQLSAAEAEWRAKLAAAGSNSSSTGGDTSGGDGGKEEDTEDTQAPFDPFAAYLSIPKFKLSDNTLTPDTSAYSYAKNIVDRVAYDNGYISNKGQSEIYTELARLIATTNLDREYIKEVIAALRSMGFSLSFSVDLAEKPYVSAAFRAYTDMKNDTYNELVKLGYSSSAALSEAEADAKAAVMDTLEKYKLSKREENEVLKMIGIY